MTSNFFTLDVPGGEIAKIGENYFDSRLYVMPSIPVNLCFFCMVYFLFLKDQFGKISIRSINY